jgi:hypothetical protein
LLRIKYRTPSNNKSVEDAFPVFEEELQAKSTNKGMIPLVMPNKRRLTPISIMVVDTISDVKSRILLKVLFDPGSTATLISRKCLPPHCKPCTIDQTRTISTLAGSCTTGTMVILKRIRLPEFDKNRIIEKQKALVFDGKCKYDVILGADFL